MSGLLKILLPNSPIENLTSEDQILETIYSQPVQLKRCGVETKLIIQNTDAINEEKPHSESIVAIQDATRNAIRWNQELLEGLVKSTEELADKEQLSQRYLTQIIKLAYLSPDILKRILSGNIPYTMTLSSLKKNIPLDWSEQEQLFALVK